MGFSLVKTTSDILFLEPEMFLEFSVKINKKEY